MKRVGIIGCGGMGSVHADAWQQTNAQLLGIYDIDPQAAKTAAERFGVQAFPSREALLEAVEIVDVCTPTFAHPEPVLAALRAGKHTICEKPMALTLEACAEEIRTAEKYGVRLFIAQVLRFFSEYALAKQLIDAGKIGKLGVIRQYRGGSHPGEGPRHWFAEEDKSGGVILDLMVHDFDYARYIAGDVERVYCSRYLSDSADYALVTLRFKSGAIGHIEGCWAYPTGMFRTGFDIAGDDGLLTADSESSAPLRLRLQQTEAAKAGMVVPSSPLAPEDNPYLKEIQHFYDCINTGKEFLVTAKDAMAAVQIALAAHQSARSGEPVTLPPLAI